MRNSALWIVGALLVISVHAAAQTGSDQNKDKQEIRALEERFAADVRAKDLEAIMKGYAPGAQLFVFDVTPPRQHVGFDSYRKDWQEFLAAFPGHVDKFEVQEKRAAQERKELEQQHKALDHEIAEVLGQSVIDDLKIKDLKRRKLVLKDEMERLRHDHAL